MNHQATAHALKQVREVLSRTSFNFANEAEFQEGIAAALNDGGVAFLREVRLSVRDRVDFMVHDYHYAALAIEVKIEGSISALTRQIHRYAQSAEVDAILVVTSLRRLANLPDTINGRPISTLVVSRGL